MGSYRMMNDTWTQVLGDLKGAVGKNSFSSWIEPLQFAALEDGVATFHVPTTFIGNYVDQNFGDLIKHHISKSGQDVQRLRFSVQNGAKAAVKSQSAAKPVAQREAFNGAPIDRRFTFDSFVVGKPNELAHAAARRVAEGGPVTFNPLFLYGGVGLGKTHLMHAIADELQSRQPELNVLYLSAEQFMYRFITALRDRKMMDFKSLFRSVDVPMN